MNIFCYQGYHFLPVGNLPEEDDFFAITRRLKLDVEIGLSKRGPRKYSWEKFYEACGGLNIDIFFCLETKRLYLPCENELFIYQPEVGTYYHNELENLRTAGF